MKTHPLTKLQLWHVLILAVSMCLGESIKVSGYNLLFLFSMLLFLSLSIVTIGIGWLMVVKKVDVIYPIQNFGIRYAKKTREEQAATNLVVKYSQPWWKITIGVMNLFGGFLCLILAAFGIVVSIQAL
jgi:hypothetical protein